MGDNHMYCSRMVFALLAYALLSRPMWAETEATLPRGHVFFQTDFESDDALQQWSGSATLVPDNSGGRALFIERSGDSPRGSATVQMTLPVQEMRGYIVYFSARVRAHDVSHKPNPWNGVKFMPPWVDGDGVTNWPSLQLDEGTFDWKRVAFRVAVPQAAQKMSLVLANFKKCTTCKSTLGSSVQSAGHRTTVLIGICAM